MGKEVGLGRERGMTVEADVRCGGEEGVVGRVMCIEGNVVKEDAWAAKACVEEVRVVRGDEGVDWGAGVRISHVGGKGRCPLDNQVTAEAPVGDVAEGRYRVRVVVDWCYRWRKGGDRGSKVRSILGRRW